MSEHPETAPARTRRRTSAIIVAIVLVLVLAVVGGGSWWFGSALPAQQAAEARATEQAAADTAAKKKADDSAAFWAKVDADNKARAAQDAQDRAASLASKPNIRPQMEAQGWTLFAGDFYYQYADKSEYTCGYYSCLMAHVTTMADTGCPGGLYVEATVDRGATNVGRTNAVTGALTKGKDAIIRLTDTTGQGDKIGLTGIKCLGG
jgi:hypothetical protein